MDLAVKSAYSIPLAIAALYFLPTSAHAQGSGLTLSRTDEAHLDSLAALTAKKIREAQLTEKEPSVLVIDFFRNSPGTTTQLGTILANRFSELLSGYATGMKVFDRRVLKDYLTENWTTLEDFRSYDVCYRIARQLGATGAVLGTLAEKDGRLDLTLHLEGFGPHEKEDNLFGWRDRTVSFSPTEDLRDALFRPGPNYARSADKLPDEPGTFRSGVNGVTLASVRVLSQPRLFRRCTSWTVSRENGIICARYSDRGGDIDLRFERCSLRANNPSYQRREKLAVATWAERR